MLRELVVVGSVGLVVFTAAGAAIGGSDGALSALVGSALAYAVLLIGLLSISLVVRDAPTSMAGAYLVYLGQLIVLTAALLAVRDAPWLQGTVASATAILQTLALQVAQIHGYVRSRHVLYPEGGRA